MSSMQYAFERSKPRLDQEMSIRALPADVVRRDQPGWVSMQRPEDATRSSHPIPAPRSAWSTRPSIVTGPNPDPGEPMPISTGCVP